jgi:hypothetical protein
MNITLHGVAYLATAFCALWGAATILNGAQAWVFNRFTRSGWRIHRRWDRPGAPVILLDGREGAIEEVFRDTEAGAIALVIFDGDGPEWVLTARLSPRPKCLEVADA